MYLLSDIVLTAIAFIVKMSILLAIRAPLLLLCPSSRCYGHGPRDLPTNIGLLKGLRREYKLLLTNRIGLRKFHFYFGRKIEGVLRGSNKE